MTQPKLATIVVNNYNYGRFLNDAVDSALAQTYPATEVIVVDDGSTDDSREVIAGYGSRVTAVLKENGGQGSAFNAGMAASHGSVVVFLDADDVLLPTAVERACERLQHRDVAKVHWPLWVIDAKGERTGKTWPHANLSDGDFRAAVARHGPACTASPPTSGNAWARWFLEQVMPIPQAYTLCADEYLFTLAPAFGVVRRVKEPQSCYRFHGANQYQRLPLDDRIRLGLRVQEQQCAVLAEHYRRAGVPVDPEEWRRRLWFPRLNRAIQDVLRAVPTGATFILVDEDQWGTEPSFHGRRRRAFTERNGAYWGPPADDAAATAELERLCREGASYLVVAEPAFWWLKHYAGFAEYLTSRFPLAFESELLVIFDMTRQAGQR